MKACSKHMVVYAVLGIVQKACSLSVNLAHAPCCRAPPHTRTPSSAPPPASACAAATTRATMTCRAGRLARARARR